MNNIRYRGKELLPPKSDVVFKAIFGGEENKYILSGFLRDVLELDIEDYKDIQLLNTEATPDYGDDKLMRMDVAVKLKTGERIDIEIQVENNYDMVGRSVAYESELFSAQIIRGAQYKNLSKAITLIILHYNLFKDEEFYYNVYRYKNTRNNSELTDLAEIRYMELPKFKVSQDFERLENRDLWALFLSTEREEVLDLLAEKSGELEKAVEKLVTVSAEEKLRHEYLNRLFSQMDYDSAMGEAMERGFAKGEAEGRFQGFSQGISEGISQGISEGISKGLEQKALEAAINFKKAGVDAKIIAECVGLSLEIVESLSVEKN